MIRDIVEDLLSVDDRTWALYAYRKEPLRGKVSFEDYYALHFPDALADARRMADEYAGKTVEEMEELLSLRVEMIPMRPGQTVNDFAVFNEPDTVCVYEDNALESQKIVDHLEDERIKVSVTDMLVSHEIFHALQSRHPDLLVNRPRVKLWKLFGYENVSRLVSLEEVAAMYFTKYFLGMEAVPYVYDVIMCMSRAPGKAKELYASIMEMKEESDGK